MARTTKSGLVISPMYPIPPNTGAFVRISNILEGLSNHYEITFASLANTTGNIDKIPYLSNIVTSFDSSANNFKKIKSLLSINPYHVELYYSKDLKNKINAMIKSNNYSFIYCNFIYTLTYIPNDNKIPVFLDQHNVDIEYWYRKIKYSKNLFLKLISYNNYLKTKKFEKKFLSKITSYISVSNLDSRKTKEYASEIVKNFLIVPNGVKIDSLSEKELYPYSNKILLGFLGSMDLEINQKAVNFIVNKILPELRKNNADYDYQLLIIGRNPPASILKYNNNNIHITGTVVSTKDYLRKIDIFVCPIFGGAGTKLRLFEAMAEGLPVVGTSFLFQGVNEISHGNNAFVANELNDFVKFISILSKNQKLRFKIGKNAKKMVIDHYDWKKIVDDLALEMEKLLS